MKRLAKFFWECFKISLFVIGGGYAIIAVADAVFSKLKITEEGEILDNLPVFQMVPGLIATHTAVYVGRKIAGWKGALTGVIAMALPSIGIFLAISQSYQSLPLDNPWLKSAFVGLRAALTGIIAATAVNSWRRTMKDAFAYLIAGGAFLMLMLGGKAAIVLILAIMLGLGMVIIEDSRQKHKRHFPAFAAIPIALLVFIKYGLLGFGGGFVLVPMYLQDFVGASAPYLQLEERVFADVMSLSQMTPGPVGVNCATFLGYRLGGIGGALIASILLLLPGSLLAYFAFASMKRFQSSVMVRGILRGARPAALALLISALWSFLGMTLVPFNWVALILILVSMGITMKKKINIVALIIICALVAGVARADESITAERFPDADTVVVNDIEHVEYNPDGTYESVNETWTKLLTEKGRREESEQQLDFNRRYGDAEFLYVGVIDDSGVEREIDVRATTKETTDNSSMSANIYDPLDRKLRISIPGLKIGETLHLKTQRRTQKARCQNQWADISMMEWSRPILKAVYEVKAPKELPVRKFAIRHPLGNMTEERRELEDGSTLYVFTATNSPQAFPEPDMPPLYTQLQHVRISTAADWKEISKWYWQLCLPHLEKTNAAMTNKVEELGRDMRAIYKFVSQEVRYMGLTMEDTSPGYAPHDVNITFDNRYGVCRDKAGLLVAMLRIAGIEAFPVLIHAGAKLDPEVPQPFFNHAIVAIKDGDGYQLMDPTDENAKELFPPWLCNCSYLVARPEGETLLTSPILPPKANGLNINSKAIVDKDGGMFLENEITMNGVNDSAYRHALVRRTPEERTKLFERIVRGVVPGAELIKCEIEPADMRNTEQPIVIRLASKLPEMMVKGLSREELSVPFLSKVLGIANMLLEGSTSLIKRRFALKLDSTAEVRERMEISGLKSAPVVLPQSIATSSSPLNYELNYAYTNSMLTVERSLEIPAIEYSPEEYLELKARLKEIEAIERKKPVFEIDELEDADVEYLLSDSTTDLTSERSWVSTNRTVKRVLTYAGKKGSAELKFDFNSTWKNIEIVSAVVSNVDGRVAAVSEKEINVLDAGWSAQAPRYPASKTMVVSLPMVEIGSIIAVTTVTTVSNAPSAFFVDFLFDAYEPLREKRVRVNGWSREVKNPKRLKRESSQPSARLWRDMVTISSNRFEKIELKVGSYQFAEAGQTLREIRDWMAKYVRVVGPGMYAMPLELQLTPPERVVQERYATRLDYVRTLCALLKGAGYEARVVLAADNANLPMALKKRMREEFPEVAAFSSALCRVKDEEGRELFLGTENEYSELGATAFEGCDYFDPATAEFGVVKVSDEKLVDRRVVKKYYYIREDGAVDYEVEELLYGSGVGGFRKRYAEMLPEDRSRHFQEILGGVAQAATATRELETEIEQYPARRFFACYIPEMAVVTEGAITIDFGGMGSSLPALTGAIRAMPIGIGAEDESEVEAIFHFPKGWTQIEHLPEEFELGLSGAWVKNEVESEIKDEALTVTIRRHIFKRSTGYFGSEMFALIKDWQRMASSRASRTITVRKNSIKNPLEVFGKK